MGRAVAAAGAKGSSMERTQTMHIRYLTSIRPIAPACRLKVVQFALGAALMLHGGPALASGDPDDGHRLAASWCSSCHQVELRAQTSASDAVPSFWAIAARPSTTSMSVRVFLSTPHAVMPDFELASTQIDDVGAYILSLRGRQPM